MEPIYVSLEVSKLLDDAGFDWECKDKFYDFTNVCKIYKKPSLDIAQRWLREVKNIHIEIVIGDHSSDWGYYLITDIHKPDNMPIINGIPKMSKFYDGFKSYEESQEAGIKKALEIILKKGE